MVPGMMVILLGLASMELHSGHDGYHPRRVSTRRGVFHGEAGDLFSRKSMISPVKNQPIGIQGGATSFGLAICW